jgi:hypothetical protein
METEDIPQDEIKPTKPKRTRKMTPEMLEKLAAARQKALEVKKKLKGNEMAKIEHMQSKLEKKKAAIVAATQPPKEEIAKPEPEPEPEESVELNIQEANPPVEEKIEPPQEFRPPVMEERKKKTKVIYEAASSDEEQQDQIIYIKKRKNKKPPPRSDQYLDKLGHMSLGHQEQQMPPQRYQQPPRQVYGGLSGRYRY